VQADAIKTETLAITSPDGAEIKALFYRPQRPAQNPTLFFLLPAMGVMAAYYRPVGQALAEQGYSVMLCDLRGQGTSNRKAPKAKFGYKELLEQDLPAYIDAAQEHCPDKKLIMLGHSFGGHLSLLYASAHPNSVSAVAIIASGSVWYKAYAGAQKFKIWFGTQSSVLLSALFRYFPGDKIGFGGKQPKAIMRDWARQGRTGRFKPKGSAINYEAKMADASFPLFALSIDNDTFAPHSATDHLIGKLPKAALTRHRFTPTGPNKNKVNHFRWVKYHDGILNTLVGWEKTL
jgi:predicted alpha/beta hydrolase